MKKASCVFNTFGIIGELFLTIGLSCACPQFAVLVIILFSAFLALVIGGYVSHKRHIALGIALLIFVSLLGGIFYLCWNDKDQPIKVVVTDPNYSSIKNTSTIHTHTSNENEKIELLNKYKKLLDSGVITQEEFDKKKESLLK